MWICPEDKYGTYGIFRLICRREKSSYLYITHRNTCLKEKRKNGCMKGEVGGFVGGFVGGER